MPARQPLKLPRPLADEPVRQTEREHQLTEKTILLWIHAALLEYHQYSQLLKHAPGHLSILELPDPSCAAKVMHEVPCTVAATAAQEAPPGRCPARQGHRKTDQWDLGRACLPGAAVLSFHLASTAAQVLLCLQAHLTSRLALTSADWLHTCSRSGTMMPTPSWAASPSLPTVGGRSGGAAACARLGSRTGGRQQSTVAPEARAVHTTAAMQFAPAKTWPTTTQRWRLSGTGGPTRGTGDQRL